MSPATKGFLRAANALVGLTALVVLLAVLTVWWFWYKLERYQTQNELVTLSPDLLYRCKIVEEGDSGHTRTHLWISQRAKPSSTWREKDHLLLENDSASMGAYMVEWQTDAGGKTFGLDIYTQFNGDSIYAKLRPNLTSGHWEDDKRLPPSK